MEGRADGFAGRALDGGAFPVRALRDGLAGTLRDLTRLARVEQPPMARMLARMERDGLIRRVPDPEDGRSSRITLTEAAQARLPDAIATLLRGNRGLLQGFTEEEAGLLTRLIAKLDRVAGAEALSGASAQGKGERPDPPAGG